MDDNEYVWITLEMDEKENVWITLEMDKNEKLWITLELDEKWKCVNHTRNGRIMKMCESHLKWTKNENV